ncbi:MAG: (4Fe-4S)-binding protein [Oscillospiraceae bacterium]
MAQISAEDIKRVKGFGFLHNKNTDDLFSARVITENGMLNSDQLAGVNEVAKKYGNGNIAFTTRLTLELPGIKYEDITAVREELAKIGMATGGTGSRVRPIVACKGSVCGYGNADTQGIATRLHKEFYEKYYDVKLPHKFKIAIGGCPNNCIKPSLNDLGIVCVNIPDYNADLCAGCKKCGVEAACPVGAAKMKDGKLFIDSELCNDCGRCIGKCHMDALEGGTKGFKIYLGGRWGKQIQHGMPLAKIYTLDEVFKLIEKVLLIYREQGVTGERFGATLTRLGMEHIERELASDAILDRKQEILDAALHLTGGLPAGLNR